MGLVKRFLEVLLKKVSDPALDLIWSSVGEIAQLILTQHASRQRVANNFSCSFFLSPSNTDLTQPDQAILANLSIALP